MITYYKLMDYLRRNGMTAFACAKKCGIGMNAIYKITNNQDVSMKAINKLCAGLGLQPSDIMEYIPDENTES